MWPESNKCSRCLCCYGIFTGAAKSQDLEDNELISIAHRLTTLEMKELNERQRAEHASCMYEQQKTLFRQLEDRNFELEHKFAEVKTASFPVMYLYSPLCRVMVTFLNVLLYKNCNNVGSHIIFSIYLWHIVFVSVKFFWFF